MQNNTFRQVVCAFVLSVAALFFVNPMDLWMPDDVHMGLMGGVVVLTALFGAFVLSEGRSDEREESHQAFAGRIAFFAGALFLAIGITIQTFAHALDPWLVYTLVAMIAAKVGARIYAERTR
jgi:hypothetical protein